MNTIENAYSFALKLGAFHRATGVSSKAKLATAMPQRLPSYVTDMQAHDAFVDALYGVSFGAVDPDYSIVGSTARNVCGAQTGAASHPSYAVTGLRTGREQRFDLLAEDGTDAVVDTSRALTEEEALEEFVAASEGLTDVQRETLGRMLDGLGCPDDVKPSTYRVREHSARNAMRVALKGRLAR